MHVRVVTVEQHLGKMGFGTLMAVRTLHPWSQFLQGELSSGSSTGRMAAKAAQFIVLSHQPSGRFRERSGYGALRAEGRTEAFDIAEIAYSAFKEVPVFRQDESLTDGGAGSHDPSDRKGESLCSIGDGIIALAAFSLDAVGVLADRHRKQRVIDEGFAVFRRFQRMPHRSVRLRLCLGVTLDARGCSWRSCLRNCDNGPKQIREMPPPYPHVEATSPRNRNRGRACATV